MLGPREGNICGSDMDGASGVAGDYKGSARARTDEASTRAEFRGKGEMAVGGQGMNEWAVEGASRAARRRAGLERIVVVV